MDEFYRQEQLEMVRLYHEEFEYRHRLFWELTCKALFAVLFLMALPYFIQQSSVAMKVPMILFPASSGVLCLLTMWLLHCEAWRMRMTAQKCAALKASLNGDYAPLQITACAGSRLSKKLACVRVTNLVLLLFLCLLLIASGEFYLLITNQFFAC